MTTEDHGLKRELKLRDLVLMQVLLIVGLNFTGYAARQGGSQAMLWVIAILLFYVPQAIVVMHLSRKIPLEGGVYQWVKEGISPFAGFMAGWGYVVFAICWFASYGSQVAEGFSNAGGPGWASIATSKTFALAMTVLLSLLAVFLNVRGLRVTKWLSNGASILLIAIFLTLVYLLGKAWIAGKPGIAMAFSLALPGFSLLTINVFTKMALFALSGFDQCSVFTEECRKPKNDVARSVVIAAPLIAAIYIVSTSALLAYLRPENLDLAAPVAQALRAGFGDAGAGRILTAASIAVFNASSVVTLVVVTGIVSRLPMVAGWDGVLPAWWSELRRGNPVKAIVAVAVSITVMGAVSLLGAHNEEAVQTLSAVAFGSYCITYLLMFGSVIFGFRATGSRPSLGIRAVSLVAFCAVVVCLALELVPIGDVASPLLFAVKVTIAMCAANGLGVFLYWRGSVRKKRLTLS